jgi:hypothetical protein
MQILDTKSDSELLQSLLAEIAKAQNEIRCSRSDIEKAQNRLRFCIMVANTLIDRKDQRYED